MKKWILFLACLPLAGVTVAHAQESRMDASVSYSGLISPTIVGNAVHQSATIGDVGVVASYRYLLTPRGAAEVNYGYNRYIADFSVPGAGNPRIHTQFQEYSAEYVYSAFSWHNFFPFVEGGVGGYFFGIINDNKSNYGSSTFKSTTAIGVPYGAGVVYELSPSFDIRAEYRGIVVKAPNYGASENVTNTGRYENINDPVIGVAYHF
jgi:outer membrane immunogenic protein